MSDNNPMTEPSGDARDLVAQADMGARHPSGIPAKMLLYIPLAWSLFQLWYASPLPFLFDFGVLNDTEARSIHLAFAIFLAFMAYPAFKRSPRDRIPVIDWVFAFVAAWCAGYLFLFYAELSQRAGAPTTLDLVTGGAGLLLLLEATRRALGPPLMVVASVFLFYTLAGPIMPDVIAHGGASINKLLSHQWLSTEGVFGVALGVSTSFVFLFVLFGALLEQAGAGNYFIKVAFSLLGHMRGGPAKAAVVASGATGLISGSSIANVVTTGTFTIPLMKRVGFPGTKAGAVEVAASTNGQLTPPIMGAAAFLMVEYVGISYLEVIKHAFLPAIISYIALVYIVHLEACKAGMKGLPRRTQRTFAQSALVFMTVVIGLMLLTLAVYYGIGWIKDVAGGAAIWIVTGGVAASYLGLVWYAAQYPELEMDDPNDGDVQLPEVGPTVKSGLYFLLPVVLLVWCLTVERFSPGLSAFWATVFMIFIVVTQRPLQSMLRGRGATPALVIRGFTELRDGLISGARNMIGIGVATAAAGIVVGTVTLTGIGLVMTEFVEFISGGNIMLMLIFTALISLILGMGLPTTANYIVVSTLMAPVVVSLGAQHGLLVPLIAVHLFVFYFGIMADITPPVGLAAFAASAISGADPIRTGVQAFVYAMLTAVLPFMFIFNTEIIMVGVETIWYGAFVFLTTLTGTCLFAAGTQGYFLTRNRIYESVLLVLVAFTMVRPGFWMDRIYPPLADVPPTEIAEAAEQVPEGDTLRLWIQYETLMGDVKEKAVLLPLGEGATGEERLQNAGLELLIEGDSVIIDNVAFSSPAAKAGLDFDQKIITVREYTNPPAKQWAYIPALFVLGLVVMLQRARRDAGKRDEGGQAVEA